MHGNHFTIFYLLQKSPEKSQITEKHVFFKCSNVEGVVPPLHQEILIRNQRQKLPFRTKFHANKKGSGQLQCEFAKNNPHKVPYTISKQPILSYGS